MEIIVACGTCLVLWYGARLILNGDLDNITPLADARIVASRFPDSTLVVMQNSGHVTALSATLCSWEYSARRVSRCTQAFAPFSITS